MADDIIIFPEFDKIKNEIERLRIELSMLLLERDELQFVICRNIEAKYMLEFGSIEYRAYEAQCTALRLKRKIELIQAKRNRQEPVSIVAIEEILDQEFASYQKQLDERISKMNEALQWKEADALSEDEIKELKMLYRKLVKILHSDMNPDRTDAQKELFEHAVTAYKNGDLATLRMIDAMVGSETLIKQSNDTTEQLNEEKRRLQNLLKKIQESIDQIKTRYPYTMKEILEDEEKTEQLRQQYEEILGQYEERILFYRIKIEEMMGLLALLHGKNGESLIPKPFERDIFLLDTHVAGTTHIEGIDELELYLKSGDRLNLFREPDNPYDEFAILIKTMDGVKIGYIPQKDNIIFARLMDAGKLFWGKITEKEKKGNWLRIKIQVFMHE